MGRSTCDILVNNSYKSRARESGWPVDVSVNQGRDAGANEDEHEGQDRSI